LATVSEGPFRGLAAFDEASRDRFFGRSTEREALLRLTLEGRERVLLVSGGLGVGKTSLVRAALIPHLSQRGALAVYLTSYASFERELGQALARVAGGSGGSDAVALLARLTASQPQGAAIVLDHVGDALSDDAELAGRLADFMTRVHEAVAERARFVLVAESTRLAWVAALESRLARPIAPDARMIVEPLETRVAAEAIERTVLASGAYFEQGLSDRIAEDLTQAGRVLPADLQITCRTAMAVRATTLNRYAAAGGAASLQLAFIDRALRAAGRRAATRLLAALVEWPGRRTLPPDALAQAAGLDEAHAAAVCEALQAAGILRREREAGVERFGLAHEILAGRVRDQVGTTRQRIVRARLTLSRRVSQDSFLRPHELFLVRRAGLSARSTDDERVLRRSVRLLQMIVSALVFALVATTGLVYRRAAGSYELKLEDGAVVARLSRPGGLWGLLPHSPSFGAMIGDLGVPAASLLPSERDHLARGQTGESRLVAGLPAWLAETFAGMRPALRGSLLVLLGRADGYDVLHDAMRAPDDRSEVLRALAHVGRGDPREAELLVAALGDERLPVRRLAVEVAVDIGARHPGSQLSVLQAALRDRVSEVAHAALDAAARLPAADAGALLASALGSAQVELRRSALDGATALGERDPSAAASALSAAQTDADPGIRHRAAELLDALTQRAGAKVAPVLERRIADPAAAEPLRIAAMVALSRAPNVSSDGLAQALAQAVASPSERLRVAALPLFARSADPAQVMERATAAQGGPPPLRAAAAAAYGALAARHTDVGTQLKALSADGSAEVRAETARALAGLGKDAVPLLDKATRDGNADVERAAVDTLGAIARLNPYAIAGILEKTAKNGRASLRRAALEAIGRVAEAKPSAASSPLARALKEQNPQLRASAVVGMCLVAGREAATGLPYLRVAARDPDPSVRVGVARCGRDFPALAGRLLPSLASDTDASVREEVVAAVANAKSDQIEGGALASLLSEGTRPVRLAALTALGRARGLRDPDRLLSDPWAKADADERVAIARSAGTLGAARLLLAAASDRAVEVRRAAMEAAASVGAGAAGVWSHGLDDRERSVRLAALAAITAARAGPAGAPAAQSLAPGLRELIASGDAEERAAALAALGLVAPDEAARTCRALLESRSEADRASAARGAAELADGNPMLARPLLERALGDAAYDVRRAAVPGLARAYARARPAADLESALSHAEVRAPLRAALLQALALQLASDARRNEARASLDRAASKGPPLARVGAAIVLHFAGTAADLDEYLAQVGG
jgi:HEAT repeat protein